MGGRSREPRDRQVEAFSFLKEVSLDRLVSYGNYSSLGYQNMNNRSLTEQGVPADPQNLNKFASQEYTRRTGQVPSWDLAANGGHENRQQKLDQTAVKHGLKPSGSTNEKSKKKD